MGIVDSPKFGGIRTERGPAGYVVSVGEKDAATGFVHWRTETVTLGDPFSDRDAMKAWIRSQG
jgi:hypothetical protein